MTKEEAIKYLEKRKEKALMLMEESKADTPINNKVRGILTRKLEALDMAISALKEPTWQEKFEKEYLFESIKEDMAKLQAENERLLKEVEALKGEWIPVNDIEDIPKSGSYWVTKDYAYSTDVEKIRWSDAWRCWVDYDTDDVLTKESASLIIAYMPYFEPEPYEKGE